MVLKCPQPSRLQSLSSNKAECIRAALRQLDMIFDAEVDRQLFRVVDAFVCDGFKANPRAERAINIEHKSRSSLGLLCDAHKKAIVSSLAFVYCDQ